MAAIAGDYTHERHCCLDVKLQLFARSRLLCHDAWRKPGRATKAQKMQAKQLHLKAFFARGKCKRESNDAERLHNFAPVTAQLGTHDLCREEAGPGFAIGGCAQFEADRPLACAPWRAQAQRQQPRESGARRHCLYPAMQLMTAGKAMKTLHCHVECREFGTHHLFVHGNCLCHDLSSIIWMSSPCVSIMKSSRDSSPVQGSAPVHSRVPAASLRTSAAAASVGT